MPPAQRVTSPHLAQLGVPCAFDDGVAIGRATLVCRGPKPTAVVRRHGLEVIDPLPAFRAAHAQGRLLYGRVDTHLSPAGHAVLADLIAGSRLLLYPSSYEGFGLPPVEAFA